MKAAAMETPGKTSPTRGTKTEGRNSAPATWPTSLTAARAGALAVKAVTAAAAATLFVTSLFALFFPALILVATLAPLVTFAAERGMLLAALTFILLLGLAS